MAGKFNLQLTSDDRRRSLPHRLLLAAGPNETARHVALKLLGYLLFWRDRLQIETEIPDDSIPFVPDLCQLGYDLRPLLWIECGDCGAPKLRKVAARCHAAEIWCLKRSAGEAQGLLRNLEREGLRGGRLGILAFDTAPFEEFSQTLQDRNDLHWFRGGFAGEPGFSANTVQLELNQLWFEFGFQIWRY